MSDIKEMQVVSFTEAAQKEILSLMATENLEVDQHLRVGAKGGGCSGLSYVLDFDKKGPMDELHEINGIKILIDPRQALYIMGIEVDFQKGLNDRGFIFNNPNAKDTCGCGTSFST